MHRRSCWLTFSLLATITATTTPAMASTVGVASVDLADPTRHDPIVPKLTREWRVDIYYPALPARRGKPRPYLPDRALLGDLRQYGYYDVPPATLQRWADTAGPARAGLKPASMRAYPLITISPGSGIAAFSYAELAAAFVARGYIVAVIDHPYLGISRLPGGRLMRADDDPVMQKPDPADWTPRVREWSRDVSIVIDRLLAHDAPGLPRTLRIDPRRITVTGHSLGGTVALQVCSDDDRVNACADFEGAPDGTTAFTEGPRKPSLFTGSRSVKPERPQTAPDMTAPPWSFLDKGPASNWAIAIAGGSHMSYSDAPREMPDTLSRFGGTLMTVARSNGLYTSMIDAFAHAYAPGGGGDAAFSRYLSAQPEVRYSGSRHAGVHSDSRG